MTLVKEKLDKYQVLWKGFVLSHNKFVDVADAEELAQSSEWFNGLAQERIILYATVEEFICNAAIKLNDG